MARRVISYQAQAQRGTLVGEIPTKHDVVARVIANYDSASLAIWYGFTRPPDVAGYWPGAFKLAYGDKSPIFEAGDAIYFAPDSGTDGTTMRVAVQEELL